MSKDREESQEKLRTVTVCRERNFLGISFVLLDLVGGRYDNCVLLFWEIFFYMSVYGCFMCVCVFGVLTSFSLSELLMRFIV